MARIASKVETYGKEDLKCYTILNISKKQMELFKK